MLCTLLLWSTASLKWMHACPGAQLWLPKQQGKNLLKSFQETMKVDVEGSRRTPCFCKGRSGKTREWRIVALLPCVKTRREGRSAMRYCSLYWLPYPLFCLWQNEGLKHSKQCLSILHFPRSLQHFLVDIAQFKPTALWKERNGCFLSCFCHLFHCCVTHLNIFMCIIFFHLGESPLIIVFFLMSVYVWTFLLVGFFQISAGVHCR